VPFPRGLEDLQEGFLARLDRFGWCLQIVRTGQKFKGIIQPVPAFDPTFELGSDIREKGILYALSEDVSDVVQFDRLTVVGPAEDPSSEEPATLEPDGDEEPIIWKVTRIENNPGDYKSTFWLENVVPGKDT